MSTSASEQHEWTQLDELQRRYDTLTKRIAAVDTDIDRALTSVQRQILKEQRAELAAGRDAISSQLAKIENHRNQTETIRVQDIQSNNLVLAITRTSQSSIHTSLRLLDGEIISGLALFEAEVEGASLRVQLHEYPMLAFRYENHEVASLPAAWGRHLYQWSIPEPVAQRLKALNPSVIDLVFDEDLQDLPWETLYDEEGFLGFRHTFGRRIGSSPSGSLNTMLLPSSYPAHDGTTGLSVLVVVPPTYGSMPYEARIISDVCSTANPSIDIDWLIPSSRQQLVKALYRKPDIVHWIGHSCDDKLQLGNDAIPVDMLAAVASELGQYCFYFFNVCYTARLGTQKPIGYYLARQGVSSVCLLTWVGGSAEEKLVHEFYTSLLNGRSVGEALQLAKLKAQYTVPSWWSYVLYGDASCRLVEPKVK